MNIDLTLLDALTEQAKRSPRLRMNLDLRNTPEDLSQRMLNAIEPGSSIPIHRHTESSETVIILRGHLRQLFYDDFGKVVQVFDLKAGGPGFGISIPVGQWHTVESVESGTVIVECKDGPYHPLDPKDIL